MKDAKKRMCKLCLIPALAATPLSGMAQGVIKGTIYDSNNEPIIITKDGRLVTMDVSKAFLLCNITKSGRCGKALPGSSGEGSFCR